jgi:hypothetical protein
MPESGGTHIDATEPVLSRRIPIVDSRVDNLASAQFHGTASHKLLHNAATITAVAEELGARRPCQFSETARGKLAIPKVPCFKPDFYIIYANLKFIIILGFVAKPEPSGYAGHMYSSAINTKLNDFCPVYSTKRSTIRFLLLLLTDKSNK